ncbi:UNVERIFIED_CONTAM: Charged multivesicular body protein 3, partial [Eudyptes robustus]
MGIFGQTKKDPKEKVRELQKKLRHEISGIKRQIHRIEVEENKVKRQIKEAAKKGDKDVCLVLAKGMIQSRKTVNRLHMSVTQINSINMHIQHQLSTLRMAGAIGQSTDVMKKMQQLIKVPEIMATMREMSKELTAAGIMEEMIEDTLETLEPEDLDEKAQREVDKILWEVTAGELGKAPLAESAGLGASTSKEDEKAKQEAEALIAKLEG